MWTKNREERTRYGRVHSPYAGATVSLLRHSKMAVHSQGPRRLRKSPPSELAHGNVYPTKGTILVNAQNCGTTILLLHVVRELQLTEKKKKTTTKSEKRRRLFLHDGAPALASKVSSGYCTVPLLQRRCLSPVLIISVPEWRYFSVVLRYTNNHHHPYIDSTTVLSDNTMYMHVHAKENLLATHAAGNDGEGTTADTLAVTGHQQAAVCP